MQIFHPEIQRNPKPKKLRIFFRWGITVCSVRHKYNVWISNLLNLNSFPFAAWINRESEIDSIHSVQLSTEKDITDWCSYSFGMDKFTFNTRDVRNGQMRSLEILNTVVGQS